MDQVPPVIGSTNLSIQYELKRSDVFINSLTIFIRNRIVGGFLLFCLVFSGAMTLRSDRAMLQGRSLSFVILYLVVYLGIILTLILTLQAIAGALLVFSKKDAGIFCQHVLEISDEGLTESTEVNRGLHKWAGFHKTVMSPRYLYIYTGPSRYFQVPRREVPLGQLIAFEAELKRRIKDAKK